MTFPGPRTIEPFRRPLPDDRRARPTHRSVEQWNDEYDRFYNRTYGANKQKCIPGITTPVFLQVNQEYRAFVQNDYSPCFQHYTTNGSSLYVNFSCDTLVMSLAQNYTEFFEASVPRKSGMEYLAKIQNVAINMPFRWITLGELKTFRAMRKFTAIVYPLGPTI